jgi:hypothetical protein
VQVGAGIGLLMMLLHSFVDYNLRMPANMVFFAFLAGIFFTAPEADAEGTHRRRGGRRTHKLHDPLSSASPAPIFTPAKPPPDQIPNPFLD